MARHLTAAGKTLGEVTLGQRKASRLPRAGAVQLTVAAPVQPMAIALPEETRIGATPPMRAN